MCNRLRYKSTVEIRHPFFQSNHQALLAIYILCFSQETADLVTFTEEILNGRLDRFLCSVRTYQTTVMRHVKL